MKRCGDTVDRDTGRVPAAGFAESKRKMKKSEETPLTESGERGNITKLSQTAGLSGRGRQQARKKI